MAASAPGKLILFGEHAVVFGEPALSTAINLRAEVFVRPHREWLADGASLDEPRFRYVKKAVEKSNAPGPLWSEIRSMVPSGAGLGSSAAVTVATLGSLHSLAGSIDPPTIAREAFDVEHEVQGRASPIDTSTAAAGGGLLVLRDKQENLLWSIERDSRRWFLHRAVLPPVDFVIGNTGISAATGPLVAKVKERVDRDPGAAAAIREIGEITLDGMRALEQRDLVSVGHLMDRNHALLTELGVGHPALDRLVSAARPSSYGAKLTGAGGGGSMFALTDRPSRTAPCTRKARASSTSGRPTRCWLGIRAPIFGSRRRERSSPRDLSIPTPIPCSRVRASTRWSGSRKASVTRRSRPEGAGSFTRFARRGSPPKETSPGTRRSVCDRWRPPERRPSRPRVDTDFGPTTNSRSYGPSRPRDTPPKSMWFRPFSGPTRSLQNSRPGPRPTSISSGKRCCRRLRRIGSRTSVMHSSTEGTSRPTRP